MTSQYEMKFPFTSQKEILDWEARYFENQSKKRQCKEQAVIDIEKAVKTRQTPDTPGGYLCCDELCKMGYWKHWTLPGKIKNNTQRVIEDVTGEAFSLDDDWKKIKKLKKIKGVRESVASVILHLYDEGDYPILDKHALCSIGINYKKVNYDCSFWKEYVKFCQAKTDCYDVCMRTLDRALYKFSESGAAFALKIMADETLFLELERRGYDPKSIRKNKTTAEIVKNAI